MENTDIVSVTMPDTIKKIEYWAFYNCASLKTVRFSHCLEFIDSEVFFGCSSLKEIDLGESLQSIGAGAFKNCTALTSVTLPNTVTAIDENAFSGCNSLVSVKYLGNENEFEAINILAGNEPLTSAEISCCGIAVSFVDTDGSEFYSYTAEMGSLLYEYIPVKEGYRFDGWYIEDTDTEWIFAGEGEMSVTGDVTLVARWSIMTPPEIFG